MVIFLIFFGNEIPLISSVKWLFIIWKIDNLVGNKNLGHVRDFYGINIVYCFGPDQWR